MIKIVTVDVHSAIYHKNLELVMLFIKTLFLNDHDEVNRGRRTMLYSNNAKLKRWNIAFLGRYGVMNYPFFRNSSFK